MSLDIVKVVPPRCRCRLVIASLVWSLTACSSKPAPYLPPAPPSQAAFACGVHSDDTHLVVETKLKKLTVYRGSQPIAVFDGVALGAAGAGRKYLRGDNVTPLGCFRISEIRPSRRFLLFMELDYPTLYYADAALRDGRIDANTHRRISEAHRRGEQPPRDTALGGDIGIHGLGGADIEIHRIANWTGGCLALDNQQIMQLRTLIKPSAIIEIR